MATSLERRPRDGRRKREVLAYVRSELDAHGEVPSYGMIARALHMGERCHVNRVVKLLEAEGRLARVGEGRVRRIRWVQ